jgi:hypothetical protein
MTEMSNAIQSRVSSNWEITTINWMDEATIPYPEWALYAAETKGKNYGQQLATQGWKEAWIQVGSATSLAGEISSNKHGGTL